MLRLVQSAKPAGDAGAFATCGGRRRRKILPRALLAFALLGGMAAQAATLTVNTAADDITVNGNCTLREAIQAANSDLPVDACPAGNGADLIQFIPALAGQTLSLSSAATFGHLVITSPITIFGDASLGLILRPASTGRIFQVAATGILTLQDMTLRDGFVQGTNGSQTTLPTDGLGGAIYNQGTLLLTRVKFANNQVIGGGGAGAPDSYAEIPTIASGGPGGAGYGGAIYNLGGAVTAIQCVFANNISRGGEGGFSGIGPTGTGGTGAGAVYNAGGRMLIMQTSFSANQAFGGNAGSCSWRGGMAGDGGSAASGAVATSGGALDLINSTFFGNGAAAGYGGGNECFQGIGYGGAASGGAIFIFGSTTRIALSTFSGSTVNGGAGFGGGTTGSANGGALYGANPVGSNPALTLSNSIFANSTGSADVYLSNVNVTGALNLIRSNVSVPPQVISQTGDPLLGPLGDHGGPTQTLALLSGSPAIDAGDCAGGTISVDQRGRPRPVGTACDLGAYEFNPAEGTPGDSDGDGIPDGSDCAPFDPELWTAPMNPVNSLHLKGPQLTAFYWNAPAAAGSSKPAYDLLRSPAADFISSVCVLCDSGATAANELSPASAFYHVRVKNGCGAHQ